MGGGGERAARGRRVVGCSGSNMVEGQSSLGTHLVLVYPNDLDGGVGQGEGFSEVAHVPASSGAEVEDQRGRGGKKEGEQL